MLNVPKILLVIEDNRAHGRALLRGISRYAVLHGPWNLYRDAYNPAYGHGASIRKEAFVRFEQLECNGIITRNPKKTQKITAKGVPTIVAITEKNVPDPLPYLSINHQSVGQMAAEYFLEKGFMNFAFCGYRSMFWSELRGKEFAEHIHFKSSLQTSFYEPLSRRKLKTLNFKSEIEHIAAWLESLPKPNAIMACNDNRAADIMEAAKIAQIKVPEEIAVIGVDNDDLICNMCNPPLSSIQLHSCPRQAI